METIEEKLLTSEARYRRLFEAALDGILILNFETGQIEDANPFLINLLGFSHEEFLGKRLWEVGAFADLPEAKNMFSRLQERGYVRYEHLPLKASNGSLIDVEFISNSYDCEGVQVIQCNIRDIRYRAEAERIKARHLKEMKAALLSAVELAMEIGELRDPYTVGHEKNVALIAVAIGKELGLSEHMLDSLKFSGLLHDIGKIAVPIEILSKPGKISPSEFELVKTHPVEGYNILSRMNWPWPLATVAYQHHERLDGSGYPLGLKGGEIIPEAKIIGVADVVEAMTSHRPYRPAIGIENVMAELELGRGVTYDSDAVDACLTLFREKNFTF
ncbi:HD-GYP domain-containing protein [Pseudohaliea rubra]|uniref:Response regulator/sensory box/HDIG domain protein n=1 Tax=Pseudohaliea rubra DSM 19751 TaxID=1265313 RepID=A0A095VTE0_9GAMM|nr:HD-GYP domain-containing protein [Pseudohaliea rubra]KGE04615.1 Response regulator/sensory box/HDIG domain protein [Pseudohaliea rubra DSM 19751]